MRHLRGARGRGPDPRPPAAGLRHRDRGRGPLDAPRAAVRPRHASRATRRSSRPASRRSAPRTASTGATTRGTTRRPRAATPPNPQGAARTTEFRAMVKSLNDDRAAGRDGRRLQPHERGRPGREVGARSDRARLLPPPARGRHAGQLDLLREHRDRARHDGEAHGRLDRDVGARLQGRRLPLRPHGPPLEGEPARRPRGARRADPGRTTASTARRSTSTARAGTSARSRTTRASSRPRS